MDIERLNNSYHGNPRYSVELYDLENNGRLRGKTKSDVMGFYNMPRFGDKINVVYHKTTKGFIVFDCFELINASDA